jgi:hypothetical protein
MALAALGYRNSFFAWLDRALALHLSGYRSGNFPARQRGRRANDVLDDPGLRRQLCGHREPLGNLLKDI